MLKIKDIKPAKEVLISQIKLNMALVLKKAVRAKKIRPYGPIKRLISYYPNFFIVKEGICLLSNKSEQNPRQTVI